MKSDNALINKAFDFAGEYSVNMPDDKMLVYDLATTIRTMQSTIANLRTEISDLGGNHG